MNNLNSNNINYSFINSNKSSNFNNLKSNTKNTIKKTYKVFISPNFSNNQIQAYLRSTIEKYCKFNYDVYIRNPLLLSNINNNTIELNDVKDLIGFENPIISKSDEIKNFNTSLNSVQNYNIQESLPIYLLICEEFNVKNMFNIINNLIDLCNNIIIIFKSVKKDLYLYSKTFNTLIDSSNKNNSQKIHNILDEFVFFIENKYNTKIKFYFVETNDQLTNFVINLCNNLPEKAEKTRVLFYDIKNTIKLTTYFKQEFKDKNTSVWIKQLMCIPGISEYKAHAIALKYSFKDLMNIYNNLNYKEKEKVNLLKDIEFVTKKNNFNYSQQQLNEEINNYNNNISDECSNYEGSKANKASKIGKSISNKVYKYFTGNGDDIIN